MTDSEINEAVARKLGWSLNENFSSSSRKPNNKAAWVRENTMWLGRDSIPDYCDDIKAAWEVVEHLVPNNAGFELHYFPKDKSWTARFWADDDYAEDAGTAAMAICLAFLKLK